MDEKLITFIVGTRPEAIKLACIINLLKNEKRCRVRVVLTGQHQEMVHSVFDVFNIKNDINFLALKEGSNLTTSLSVILRNLNDDLQKYKPSLIVVQGDTTSALGGALASFYNNIPVAHVEAGLRTNSITEPFPEECNRRLISQIASLHFAPTNKSYEILKKSKVEGNIYMTGNTVIDALKYVVDNNLYSNDILKLEDKKYILATIHRRENWGNNLNNICRAFKELINQNRDFNLLLPLHPNKIVSKPIIDILGNHSRIKLVKPLRYLDLINALDNCYFILTDSGGLQEEAPSLNKPVLVLRNTTERSEAIETGAARIVGNSYENILKEANNLINNKKIYMEMANSKNPFGDGYASNRIKEIIYNFLK